jgi:uncharacterized protein YbaP (TraB family)
MLNAEEKEDTMPSKKKSITLYLGPEEYDNIQTSANRAGLSLSTFRKMPHGHTIPDKA